MAHVPSQEQKTKRDPQIHEMIQPLGWLLGKWRSEKGRGKYPTMKDFEYGEEAEFFTVGQPNIQFSLYSWEVQSKKPLHREIGFIRIKGGTNKVAFMCAHNFGVTDLQEGEVKGNELKVESAGIHRVTFACEPETKKVMQTFRRTGNELEHVLYMETSRTAMTEHLRITYQKVE